MFRRRGNGIAAHAGISACALLLVLLAANAASAGLPPDGSFVLRAKAVYAMTADRDTPYAPGVVVVRDGKVAAVGDATLAIPSDLPVVSMPHHVVMPGLVDAGNDLVNWHNAPETYGAAYHAEDGFDFYADYAQLLARGTTTVHLSPGERRLINGMGAVAKLAGPAPERLLRRDADLAISLETFNPPVLVEPPFYASSDVAIEPAEYQRPSSRLGQLTELRARIAATRGAAEGAFEDVHLQAFVDAWRSKTPLRVHAREGQDLTRIAKFADEFDRPLVVVGATEAAQAADALRKARASLVLRLDEPYDNRAGDRGADPDALDFDLAAAGRIADALPNAAIALAGRAGTGNADLRLIAAMAAAGGMEPSRALAAITRMPAEILGVANRVGTLAPGRDADLLILNGGPLALESQVVRTYVNGRICFDAARDRPEDLARKTIGGTTVVRGGTLWLGDGTEIRDGAVLIENGTIRAVGHRVAVPPFATIIDYGPETFLTPGFVDAHGHLGLAGDRAPAPPQAAIERSIATADRQFERVARAGITSVLLTSYGATPKGSRVALLKTYGEGRDALVSRALAAVKFGLRNADPHTGASSIAATLAAGKKYVEAWKKYAEELEKWEQDQAAGKETKAAGDAAEETKVEQQADPITGTWDFTMSGDPLPETVTGQLLLNLKGNAIEGRLTSPMSPGEDVELAGTLDGKTVSLIVQQETPFGNPTIDLEIDREDHMVGQVKLGDQFSLNIDCVRVDKAPVTFKVKRGKRRGEDGRPMPPPVNEALEPLRPLLAGEIPAVVDVRTELDARAAIELFSKQEKLPLVLLVQDDADRIAEMAEACETPVGVIAPRTALDRRDRTTYSPTATLADRGVPFAFQSDAEDAARTLPLRAAYAVRQGLGGDAALRALTCDAAKIYKLEDRIGALKPGCDGDVLVFTDHPFAAGSRLLSVIVKGHEAPQGEANATAW